MFYVNTTALELKKRNIQMIKIKLNYNFSESHPSNITQVNMLVNILPDHDSYILFLKKWDLRYKYNEFLNQITFG